MDSLPESSATNDDFERHWRRTAVLVRALLPQAPDAEVALREIAARIRTDPHRAISGESAESFDKLARDVVEQHRRNVPSQSFSDDLFRQIADSAPRSLDLVAERPSHLAAIVDRLPPPEKRLLRRRHELGLSAEQIAVGEGRSPSVVARDLVILNGTIVNALQEALPDGSPPSPSGAADLGRLAGRLLDGTITDDSRLVFETLLLADAAVQAHYHRHVAVTVELDWLFRGAPKLPEKPPRPPRSLTRREIVVTAAFLLACAAAAAVVILVLAGQLPSLY